VALNIDPTIADEVVEYFLRLICSGASTAAVEAALGAVASDDRPRARSVLDRLKEAFLSEQASSANAARALAASRLPRAANVLGERIADEAVRSALRSMGEQAVPVLADRSARGDLRSVDDLGEIATSSAATTLTSLIWDEDDRAFRAAWWLATLVRRPEVLDGLRSASNLVPGDAPLFDWFWRPVDGPTPLASCLGRVAWLMSHDKANHATPSIIDHRFAVALVALDDPDGAGMSGDD
jgi:hypothetical protein